MRSKMKVGFDPEKLGVLTVSLRDDGSLVWLDGQRRGALAEAAGKAQLAVPMQVFRELSLAEEADIFLGLNDSRGVTPLYTFLAELTIEKSEAVEINRIARRRGWRISDKGVRSLRSVTALRKIYRADRTGAALEATLRVAAEAWGYDKSSAKSAMLLGVASVVVESGFDLDSLVKKIRADSRGPEALLATAAGFRQLAGGTVDKRSIRFCVASTTRGASGAACRCGSHRRESSGLVSRHEHWSRRSASSPPCPEPRDLRVRGRGGRVLLFLARTSSEPHHANTRRRTAQHRLRRTRSGPE
ncbi:hypothetical protein ACIOGT_25130 [Streptomyces microflavus]|uniref:hypothetical protein n=1 Tax=Streptomyces microflavus TaxID=1919 RepID=UPI00381C48D7